jgi:hypothetical protein
LLGPYLGLRSKVTVLADARALCGRGDLHD